MEYYEWVREQPPSWFRTYIQVAVGELESILGRKLTAAERVRVRRSVFHRVRTKRMGSVGVFVLYAAAKLRKEGQ